MQVAHDLDKLVMLGVDDEARDRLSMLGWPELAFDTVEGDAADLRDMFDAISRSLGYPPKKRTDGIENDWVEYVMNLTPTNKPRYKVKYYPLDHKFSLQGPTVDHFRYFAKAFLEMLARTPELNTIIADPKWMQMKIVGRSNIYSNTDFTF